MLQACETAMSDEEVRALDKEVKRLKRIAAEHAAQLHDLIEERLPAGYAELPDLARATFEACQAWAEAAAKLKSIQTSEKG